MLWGWGGGRGRWRLRFGAQETHLRGSFYVAVEATEMAEMAVVERDGLPEAWADNEAVPKMGNLRRGQRGDDAV